MGGILTRVANGGRGKRLAMVGLEWFEDHPGGAARYMGDVARALVARGHHVSVAVPRLLPDSPPEAWVDGVRVLRYPAQGLAERWLGARDALRAAADQDGQAFDVLHSHFAPFGLTALWAPEFQKARRVVQFQGPWADESAVEGEGPLKVAVKRRLERWAYAKGQAFIVLSEAFGRVLAEGYGVDPARISVVPAAVDLQRFRPHPRPADLRSALGWEAKAPVVFAVRRLVRRMGLELLLEAFARVDLPEARLELAGEGPLRAELEAKAQALGLGGRVAFVGRVDDAGLVARYQAADLVAMPTLALEGFGLPSAEALACGTPVLATAVGANPEVLAPWPEALVPPNDAQALAERLGQWLREPKARPSAKACRQRVESHHAWPALMDRIEGVLLGG